MKKQIVMLVAAATMFNLSSCSDDDHPHKEHEEELITDVTVVLSPKVKGEEVTLTFNDPDGEKGSKKPTIKGGTLKASIVYDAKISLFNKSEKPVENITDEIKKEADEHIFCFTQTGVDVNVKINDTDDKKRDLGLESTWTVGSKKGTGKMRIQLKHQPKVKDGTCKPGDTDVDISFPITIE